MPYNIAVHAGDFVDRGSFSLEVILTMMAFKVLYPQHMHLARGNHESQSMNKIYGFEGEVMLFHIRWSPGSPSSKVCSDGHPGMDKRMRRG